MAYYNKDGVKITYFEDDDAFAGFFNNHQAIIVKDKTLSPAKTETNSTKEQTLTKR